MRRLHVLVAMGHKLQPDLSLNGNNIMRLRETADIYRKLTAIGERVCVFVSAGYSKNGGGKIKSCRQQEFTMAELMSQFLKKEEAVKNVYIGGPVWGTYSEMLAVREFMREEEAICEIVYHFISASWHMPRIKGIARRNFVGFECKFHSTNEPSWDILHEFTWKQVGEIVRGLFPQTTNDLLLRFRGRI